MTTVKDLQTPPAWQIQGIPEGYILISRKAYSELCLRAAEHEKRDLIPREVVRRIIDSPRSKRQMLEMLEGIPAMGEEES